MPATKGKAPSAYRVKHQQERPFFFARPYNEKKIVHALKNKAASHDYFGYIFSANSERPPNYMKNYFLPVYSQPRCKQHVHIVTPFVPQERILSANDSNKGILPLSTVKVQWGINKRATVYHTEDIYKYLSRFGEIVVVYSWSVNSCLVVFSSLIDAHAVATNTNLGPPWDQLITSWYNPLLNNPSIYLQYMEQEIAFRHQNLEENHDQKALILTEM